MKLYELIEKNTVLSGAEYLSLDVTEITDDSRKIKPGGAFFALSGSAEHISDALRRKAAVIVAESAVGVGAPCVAVKNARHAYAVACQRMRGCPSDKMKLIAVTGTNGKTSVSLITAHILSFAGMKTGVVGTTGNYIGDAFLPASYTTPPPDALADLLEKMADAGCKFAVMEASSHALSQRRTDGLTFDIGVFTNLTRDHMDYHKTENEYAESKARLFESSRSSVINLDDARAECRAKLADGSALAKFKAMVTAHGGDLERFAALRARPTFKFAVQAMRSGYVGAIDAEKVARAALSLGAGRERAGDRIDPLAGVTLAVGVGDRVVTGQPLATLERSASPDGLEACAGQLLAAFSIVYDAPAPASPILCRID